MPMDIKEIRQLIKLVQETGVAEIEVSDGDKSVRISCHHQANTLANAPSIAATTILAPAAPSDMQASSSETKALNANEHEIRSPMVGTFYIAAAPNAKPFVEVGQSVAVGDVLCIVEAMKMLNQIEADRAGIVKARLVNNAQPVEFDQPLFIIET